MPKKYASLAYGVIQAAVTTGIATATATYQHGGWDGFMSGWSSAWIVAWLTMLPVVVGISPLIQRAVQSITAEE